MEGIFSFFLGEWEDSMPEFEPLSSFLYLPLKQTVYTKWLKTKIKLNTNKQTKKQSIQLLVDGEGVERSEGYMKEINRQQGH